jgi:hypothetical protein
MVSGGEESEGQLTVQARLWAVALMMVVVYHVN